MGADGHINIWRDDVVRAAFHDCDELFKKLPFHYLDELDGRKYHHLYHGDNFVTDWRDEEDWYMPHYPQWNGSQYLPLTELQVDENRLMKERLREFVDWLEANATWWEVWT